MADGSGCVLEQREVSPRRDREIGAHECPPSPTVRPPGLVDPADALERPVRTQEGLRRPIVRSREKLLYGTFDLTASASESPGDLDCLPHIRVDRGVRFRRSHLYVPRVRESDHRLL